MLTIPILLTFLSPSSLLISSSWHFLYLSICISNSSLFFFAALPTNSWVYAHIIWLNVSREQHSRLFLFSLAACFSCVWRYFASRRQSRSFLAFRCSVRVAYLWRFPYWESAVSASNFSFTISQKSYQSSVHLLSMAAISALCAVRADSSWTVREFTYPLRDKFCSPNSSFSALRVDSWSWLYDTSLNAFLSYTYRLLMAQMAASILLVKFLKESAIFSPFDRFSLSAMRSTYSKTLLKHISFFFIAQNVAFSRFSSSILRQISPMGIQCDGGLISQAIIPFLLLGEPLLSKLLICSISDCISAFLSRTCSRCPLTSRALARLCSRQCSQSCLRRVSSVMVSESNFWSLALKRTSGYFLATAAIDCATPRSSSRLACGGGGGEEGQSGRRSCSACRCFFVLALSLSSWEVLCEEGSTRAGGCCAACSYLNLSILSAILTILTLRDHNISLSPWGMEVAFLGLGNRMS